MVREYDRMEEKDRNELSSSRQRWKEQKSAAGYSKYVNSGGHKWVIMNISESMVLLLLLVQLNCLLN